VENQGQKKCPDIGAQMFAMNIEVENMYQQEQIKRAKFSLAHSNCLGHQW